MAQKSIDLNKLKAEIDIGKKKRVSSILGENTGANIVPRDEFLNGLLTSLHTGKATPSSNLIKIVENKTAKNEGEIPKHIISNNDIPVQTRTNNQPVQPIRQVNRNDIAEMSPERDEQLFADLEKKRKKTLTESLESFAKPGQSQSIYQQPNQTINESYLNENVKRVVNNYLTENFGVILEEAINSTIIEMYAVERIKSVLQENKELIKTIVYEIIRELQAKSKNKAQQ